MVFLLVAWGILLGQPVIEFPVPPSKVEDPGPLWVEATMSTNSTAPKSTTLTLASRPVSALDVATAGTTSASGHTFGLARERLVAQLREIADALEAGGLLAESITRTTSVTTDEYVKDTVTLVVFEKREPSPQ